MFKFDLIEIKSRGEENNSLVDHLKKEIKLTQGTHKNNSEKEKFVFIITNTQQNLLKGGACLLEKPHAQVQADVLELISALPLPKETVWECSHIYFEHFLPRDALDQNETVRRFYQNLYESLVDFGKQHSILYLIMRLSKDAYMLSKDIGKWPYVVELRPHNSPDGLFHGVLPLTGSQCKKYLAEI